MSRINKYFKTEEFMCKCRCGFDNVNPELIEVLTHIRTHFGNSVIITSGCRCQSHNKYVGGSSRSQHLSGNAADFKVNGQNQDYVADYLENKYHGKYGIGRYYGRTHIDVRPNGPARWDYRN